MGGWLKSEDPRALSKMQEVLAVMEQSYEDGNEELIPAYGKDLEDAISRVKHDKKVEIMESRMEKAPGWVWLVTWLSYMGTVSSLAVAYSSPLILTCGLSIAVMVGVYLQWWFRNRNVDKK